MGGSRIPSRGRQHDLAKISKKLHEIEKIWGGGWWAHTESGPGPPQLSYMSLMKVKKYVTKKPSKHKPHKRHVKLSPPSPRVT